ncbi:hypothetical protein KIW84_076875 [Lathyrus oleraceus]|uniref:Uncharacterized protein n=1 Tax=Pisum sativum TaxID=3888 RepID=A0A9D4VZD7_PEA|nr:hypothetical protein KIW84_076875 [Pisum sativum]
MGDANFAKACIPIFDGDYDHWSLLMENLMRSKEYWKGRGGGHNSSRSKETVECFHCHKFDHYRNECLEWSHQTHYKSEFNEEMLLMATENGEQHEALWLCVRK